MTTADQNKLESLLACTIYFTNISENFYDKVLQKYYDL